MAVTNTKFYEKDPESQDVLDQDGLDGGSEGGSYFWIYVLVGIVVIGAIVVLVICLTGKKSKSTEYTFKDVPTTGELTAEQTQLFVKEVYDFSTELKTQATAATQKEAEAGKITDPKEKADALTKALAESEAVIDKELALLEAAKPYAERINSDKQQEINGVKSVQETVKNYLQLSKEAADAGKAAIEATRKRLEADAAVKDPKSPTADESKAIADATAAEATAKDQATSKSQAVSQAEPEIKKLFPAEKSTDGKPTDENEKPKTQ